MTLVGIVLVLIIAGLILWLINTYIPMAGAIKSLLNIVVFIVLLIWVLQAFGLIVIFQGSRCRPSSSQRAAPTPLGGLIILG